MMLICLSVGHKFWYYGGTFGFKIHANVCQRCGKRA